MMARTQIQVAVLTLAAGVLAPAPAVPQEPAAAEREAFALVARAGEAIERASEKNALWRAAERAVTAAGHAASALTAADRERDAALAAYRAAYREALAGAVTCDNGFPCTNGRIDPFDGFAAAFAAHFELLAAVSATNAAYVDAVGVAGAGEARARAARIRGLAARMRGLGAIDAPRRWNALVAGAGAEIAAGNLLHRRATEARHAADLALVDDVTRVVEALHLAGSRIAQLSRPATGGPAADAGTASAAGARDAAGTVSDAVLRAALDTAQAAMESLRSRIVAAATSVPDVRPTRAAETGVAGASEERAPAGNLAPDRSGETARPGDDGAPGNDDAPGTGTAAAEPEPADNFAGWVRALTAAARAAEQAAADAEAAAGGAGSARARAGSCSDAVARVTAAASRVTSLTVGDDRPPYVPSRTGRETYSDLFHLLDAAQRRARAACGSIERRSHSRRQEQG